MNTLAHVVQALVTGEEVAGLHDLSPQEREALADLQSLLRRPSQHLAALLAQAAEPPIPWGASSPPVCDLVRS